MAPSNKTMLFVCLLVAAVAVVVPVAQGQIIVPPIIVPPIISSSASINGILFCSANLSTNGTSPPLANATVQLRCGAGTGTLVASATTNNLGVFSIMLNLLSNPFTLIQLLTSQCRVVVVTPVVGCNATLPTGILSFALRFVGITINGFSTIFSFILGGLL